MSAWVAVSLLDESQEFQRLQAEDARASGAALGVEARVVYAESNAVLQIQQLYKLVRLPEAERPLAIVVETVVGEGLERVARAAAAAGVGWVLINRTVDYLDALRAQYPALAIGTVGTDQKEVGRIQGRQFRALLAKPEGTVLYVQGPPDTSVAKLRLEGVQEVLHGTGMNLQVLVGMWTEQSGAQAMKGWLRLRIAEEPVLVGCQNDAMAIGAKGALGEAKDRPQLAHLPFTGCDGLPDRGRRLVDEGALAATVVTPPNTGPAIRLLSDCKKAKQPFPRETLLAPVSYPAETALGARRRKL